jgi:acyl carrier protein
MRWDQTYDQILRASLPLLPVGVPLQPDAKLTDLGLDSLGTVSLLIDLEDAFGIVVPDELLTAESFATADALWSVIALLRSQQGQDARDPSA